MSDDSLLGAVFVLVANWVTCGFVTSGRYDLAVEVPCATTSCVLLPLVSRATTAVDVPEPFVIEAPGVRVSEPRT